MASEDKTYVCPNCGGEVLSTLSVLGPDGKANPDLEIKPKGSTGVCQDCNMAVSMTQENVASDEDPEDTSADPEWNPRDDPGPVRPEDEVEVPAEALATTDEPAPPEEMDPAED